MVKLAVLLAVPLLLCAQSVAGDSDLVGSGKSLGRRQSNGTEGAATTTRAGGVTISLGGAGSSSSEAAASASTTGGGGAASQASTTDAGAVGASTTTQAAGTTAAASTTPALGSTSSVVSQTTALSVSSNSGTTIIQTTDAAGSTVSSTAAASGAASSTSSGNAASSSSSSSSNGQAVVSTIVVVTTAADGSLVTSSSLSSVAPAASDNSNNNSDNSNSSNSQKWIIPLAVVGGVIALAGALFIGYRCTQRRFSDLDDDTGAGIRWPELLKRNDYENTNTLNPLGTTRREGAAGFEMDETKSMSNMSLVNQGYTDDGPNTHGSTEHFAQAGLGAPGLAMSRSGSSAGGSMMAPQPSIGEGGGGGAYYAGPQQGYYDPYLGASGAPYPPPPRVMSPQHGPPSGGAGYYDPYAQQPVPYQQTPYYPPPPRSISPFAGPGQIARSGTPPVAYRPPSVPLEQQAQQYGNVETLRRQSEDMYNEQLATSPTLSHGGQQQQQQAGNRQSMRLSIANPGGEE